MSSPDAIVSRSWDFAGLGSSQDEDPSFSFADEGNYDVTLSVTDEDGSSDTLTQVVTIVNVAPEVEAGAAQTVDGGDSVSLHFLKPSPAGLGLDVYQADEGDLFAGSIGPVTCLGNDLVTGVAPGSPVVLGTPAFTPALGEAAYYLVACHQCGGLLATGITRLAGSDTERLIGPSCTACP